MPDQAKREAAAAVLARIHLTTRHAADVRRCAACGRKFCVSCGGRDGGEPAFCEACSKVYGEEGP